MAKKTIKKATQAEIAHAEMLYCEKKWTPETIANFLNFNIKTIYAWRDKFKWDDTRDLFDTTPTELKKLLLKEATRIAKGEVRTDETGKEVKGLDADSLSKVMKAYDFMSKKASPAVVQEFLIELDNFISLRNPKLAADLTPIHKDFLISKINQENG